MYSRLASLVSEGRARLNVDQAELGRLLGVGQQAISRWERGQGRPRRSVAAKLAEVLSVDVMEVLAAAGYVGATADSAVEASMAARPLARGLPLHELAPDRFEDFTAEILQRLFPDGHVSRFGGPGERQAGIDLLVDGGEAVVAAQCKRHRQFGPQDVAQAVTATTFSASRYLLFLSRPTATAAARSEMAKYPDWELWDGEDLARYVRGPMWNTSKEDAIRLVDTYFPNLREAFLGVPRPGPWTTITEAFPDQVRDHVFTQAWSLVGRESELAQLVDAVRSGQHEVVRLIGRGGIGKTRLLRAVAEALVAVDFEVRFLMPGSSAQPDDFELLPVSGRFLLVVDDAHDRTDLAEILTQLRRRDQNAQLLIAYRPYGAVTLERDLARAQTMLRAAPKVDLGDLTQDEAEQLARQALGQEHTATVRRLALLTLDCPLATVVGGVLLRRGRLTPESLEQDEQVRAQIMVGFRDALVAETETGDPDVRRAVIDGLAALQPFRTGDSNFRDTLAKLIGRPYDRVHHHIRALEDAGVLLRRGQSLRLVPDLLGDAVLAEASVDDRSGAATGFLERVVAAASGDALAHVFVNVSRVDWQIRRQGQGTETLADALWDPYVRDVQQGDLRTLRAGLRLLKRAAHFQPERTVALAGWILAHPTNEVYPIGDELADLFPPTWEDVQHDLAPVLHAAAHDLNSTGKACDLLWALARSDTRPLNQHPEHPLRLLRDLAEYEPAVKPLGYNEAVLDAASRWFIDGPRLSPFDVLEPLLATEGSTTSYSGYTLTFRPYALEPASVMPLRHRVTQLALTELGQDDLRRAAAAARALGHAVKLPRGMHGRNPDDRERQAWTPDIVETIQRAGQIIADRSSDPVIGIAVMKAFRGHAAYGEGACKAAAIAALAGLPDTTIFRLALHLHDGWGRLTRDRDLSHEEDGKRREQERQALVARLSEELEIQAWTSTMEARLQADWSAFGRGVGHPEPLIAALVEGRPEMARAILGRVIEVPESPLASVLPTVLSHFADDAPDELVATADALLATQSQTIGREVAQAFGWNRGARSSLVEGEWDLLIRFVHDEEPAVRRSAIYAAQGVASEHSKAARDLLAQVNFRDSPELADEVFSMVVERDTPLAWDRFSEAQRSEMTEMLVHVDVLDGYQIQAFISQRSALDPRSVVDLLRRRIQQRESTHIRTGYEALPHQWDEPLRVREHREFVPILRDLRDWIGSDNSWTHRELGADLFAAVAGTYDEATLAVLSEGLAQPVQVAIDSVAAIIQKAPSTIVYEQVTFVVAALDAAAQFGEKSERTMRSAFWTAAMTGARMGTPGQPFSEDLRQRDECARIARALPTGSAGRNFYTTMSEAAQENIRREAERDLPSDPRRDW